MHSLNTLQALNAQAEAAELGALEESAVRAISWLDPLFVRAMVRASHNPDLQHDVYMMMSAVRGPDDEERAGRATLKMQYTAPIRGAIFRENSYPATSVNWSPASTDEEVEVLLDHIRDREATHWSDHIIDGLRAIAYIRQHVLGPKESK